MIRLSSKSLAFPRSNCEAEIYLQKSIERDDYQANKERLFTYLCPRWRYSACTLRSTLAAGVNTFGPSQWFSLVVPPPRRRKNPRKYLPKETIGVLSVQTTNEEWGSDEELMRNTVVVIDEELMRNRWGTLLWWFDIHSRQCPESHVHPVSQLHVPASDDQ